MGDGLPKGSAKIRLKQSPQLGTKGEVSCELHRSLWPDLSIVR